MMKVYGDYDQAELDLQYTPSAMVEDMDACLGRYVSGSAAARERLGGHIDLCYGDGNGERLDLFAPDGGGAPLLLFIHGGNWQMLSKNESAMAAPNLVERGGAFAAIDYSLAPAASVDHMVAQCRAAVAWAFRNAADYGCDPSRIYVAGHSAGAHLAAMVLGTDWEADFGLRGDIIKGACLISGLYDMEPVRLSYVNEALRLDAAAAERNSPIHRPPATTCPLIVSIGDHEPDEFKRQSRDFAAGWGAAGWSCELIELTGCNHFDPILGLGRADNPLGRALLAQMAL